jgi:hypothetical protein
MFFIMTMWASLNSFVEAGSEAAGIMSCIIFCMAAGSICPIIGMVPDIGMPP